MVQKILIFKIFFLIFSLIFFFSILYFFESRLIKGYAKIIDGDTIHIGKNKIRLHGIDAPETKQKCIFNEKKWECGKSSTLYLKKLVSKKIVECEINGTDRYKRFIGTCFVNKKNLNKLIVKNGWAIAYRYYSKKYIDEEFIAKKNKIGIWKGLFQEPYLYRKEN